MRTTRKVVLPLGLLLLAIGAACGATAFLVSADGSKAAFTAISVASSGVGGSIIASVLVVRFATELFLGIDLNAVIDMLKRTSQVTRSDHRLVVNLRLEGNDKVRIDAYHSFVVAVEADGSELVQFEMFTDVTRWGSGGGFLYVQQPVGPDLSLSDGTIEPYLVVVDGKPRFRAEYRLRSGHPYRIESHTYGVFRLSDRLVWTVEHLSKDFYVEVYNLTSVEDALIDVKINHHRESQIVKGIRRRDNSLVFDFISEVLPYQGFELSWIVPRVSGHEAHD